MTNNFFVLAVAVVLCFSSSVEGFSVSENTQRTTDSSIESTSGRRQVFQSIGATFGAILTTTASFPQVATASGGATAGKYTTIPIAKRRYYGRVQQAVHEFLLMGPAMVKSDVRAEIVTTFFDTNAVVVVPARRQDISGQCTKKGGVCVGKEIRDSRYNDMKTSMYLLGNAFRQDQSKAPSKLPTVKAAMAFFKVMDSMEEKLGGKKLSAKEASKIVGLYAEALDILDEYLDLVELPPTDSGHYDKEFDTLVGETARLT